MLASEAKKISDAAHKPSIEEYQVKLQAEIEDTVKRGGTSAHIFIGEHIHSSDINLLKSELASKGYRIEIGGSVPPLFRVFWD